MRRQYTSGYVPVKQKGLWIRTDGSRTPVLPGQDRDQFLMDEITRYTGAQVPKLTSLPGLGKLYTAPSWLWHELVPNVNATELLNTYQPVSGMVGGDVLLISLE